MFLESLLEASTQAKNRRGWATLISFLIETAAIGVLILVPMLYTDALPRLAYLSDSFTTLQPPPGLPSEPQPPPDPGQGTTQNPEPINDGVVRVPTSIPVHPYVPTEPEPPMPSNNSTGPCIGCVPGGTGPQGGGNQVIGRMLSQLPDPKAPAAPSAPVPVPSEIIEGMLIRRVQPVYPQLAIVTRTQGTVMVRAIIGRDGVIRQLQVANGHPLLVPAAVDAIRQWRYRPYYLNKQAVEVETTITVNFVLNR